MSPRSRREAFAVRLDELENEHARALVHELARDALAQAQAGAGDDGDFAFEAARMGHCRLGCVGLIGRSVFDSRAELSSIDRGEESQVGVWFLLGRRRQIQRDVVICIYLGRC